MTAGEFCHCDLVVHTTPQDIMNVVKDIYTAAQQGEYDPEDCQRIITQIESNFFSTGFRKVVQQTDVITLSFSALWGLPLTTRVLNEFSHDSWFRIPDQEISVAEIKNVNNISKEKTLESLKFSIEQLGKGYDTSGALCSWLPWSDKNPQKSYETYFCSEFCVIALQRLGFMSDMVAKHTTPNALYQHFEKNENVYKASEETNVDESTKGDGRGDIN